MVPREWLRASSGGAVTSTRRSTSGRSRMALWAAGGTGRPLVESQDPHFCSSSWSRSPYLIHKMKDERYIQCLRLLYRVTGWLPSTLPRLLQMHLRPLGFLEPDDIIFHWQQQKLQFCLWSYFRSIYPSDIIYSPPTWCDRCVALNQPRSARKFP